MALLKLNTTKSGIAFSEEIKQSAEAANALLHSGKGAGNDFLGWVNLPSSIDKAQIDAINACAAS
jgi:glucose-6-phosphate isomerase